MLGGFEWILWALLISATATDLIWGKIYNALTLPALLTGLVCRFTFGGVEDLKTALIAIALTFTLFFPLYLLKTWAAGDVKLLLAIAAWSTASFSIRLGVASILFGAVVGFVILIKSRGLKKSTQSVAKHLSDSKNAVGFRMPFAPAILCAFIILKIADLKHWNL